MDKSVSIGIATCIISIAIGAAIQIAAVMGMITQVNANYWSMGIIVLFLVGIGFLIYGIRFKPKATPSIPTANPQLIAGTIHKTIDPAIRKFIQAVICEIAGMGLIVGGALIVIRYASQQPISAGIGIMMFAIGFVIFLIGISISG